MPRAMDIEEIRQRARRWIAGDPDPETATELQSLLDRRDPEAERELSERMAGPLAFGTAGLRGFIGAGEHRMNRAVIRRTSAGLARHLVDAVADAAERGVVIGYDGRHFSQEFAEETAAVLAGAGVAAHLFTEMVPTPLVAYAVTQLGAAGGVMITASHNPPRYNGYKVYWDNGAQIIPPHDRGIAGAIKEVGPARSVPVLAADRAKAKDLLRPVPDEIKAKYLDDVAALSLDDESRGNLRIAYTPMHGVGDPLAHQVLGRFGFTDVTSVPEQRDPDPDFPTVTFPNPEEEGALDLAFELARKIGADLVLANDPDADRLAVAIPRPDRPGEYRQLTGNEVGALIGEYLIRRSAGSVDRGLAIATIVSSPILGAIAADHGVMYREVLTGFKWIASVAQGLERDEGATFLFGFEEALGYMVGMTVPDKDGLSAAAVFAELTAAAAAEGRAIDDELERIARSHGLFASRQVSLVRRGLAGSSEISAMMNHLRRSPPAEIGGHAVKAVRDVLAGTRSGDGETTPLDLPKSNVMVFELEHGLTVIARPSGTEPKLKLYFNLLAPIGRDEDFRESHQRASERLEGLVGSFLKLVEAGAGGE